MRLRRFQMEVRELPTSTDVSPVAERINDGLAKLLARAFGLELLDVEELPAVDEQEQGGEQQCGR